MPDNSKSAIVILLVLGIVGAIVLIADAVIFARWLAYLWAKYDWEERRRLQAAEATNQPSWAAPTPLAEVESVPSLPGGLEFELPTHVTAAEPALAIPVQPSPFERAVDDAEDPEMPRYPFARKWSVVDPYIAFQVVFVVSQVVTMLALLPALFWHGRFQGEAAIFGGPGIIIQCIGLFLMNGLFVGITAFYVHRYGTKLQDIGLRRPSSRLIATGFGLGLVLFLLAMLGETLVGGVLSHLLPKAVMDGITRFNNDITAGGMFEKIPSLQLKIFFALAGAVAAPIGEEVFFRGLLYNSLKHRLTVPAAIVISGLCFALIHFGPLAMIVIFPMGMVLAYVYEKTRSLWVTICMHATNNGLSFIIAMALSHGGGSAKLPAHDAVPPAKTAKSSSAHSQQKALPAPPERRTGTHPHG